MEEVDGIKKIFHQMDVDKNGNLSFKELKDGLHSIGHIVSDPDVQMIMEAVCFDLLSYEIIKHSLLSNTYFSTNCIVETT